MREYALMMTALILLSKTAFAEDKQMVGKVASEVLTARVSWWGFDPEDSTDALQAAIDSGAKKLIVDNTGKPWVVRPIKLASNQQIVFESGVEVLAKPGEFKGKGDCLFRSAAGRNITLSGKGATLRMRRADYAGPGYEKSEWRHGLSFCSCSNIKILGLTVAESGGDGIYLGSATKGVTNSNVVIKDVVCDKNYRQGISVITAENLLIENTIMRDTAGTDPQAGIDFEPNQPTERLANIVVRNCITERNTGNGYMFYLKYLTSESAPVSVRFEKCSSTGDIGASVRIANGNAQTEAVTGKIEFIGCTFKDSSNAGVLVSDVPATGFRTRFVDCSILDPAAGKPASAPIVIQSRRGATKPVGGVEFVNCTVRDSLDRNPLAYSDGGSTAGLRDVGGTINLERNGVRQTIKITPELLGKWFPASAGPQGKIPGGMEKMNLAKPTPDQAAWHDLEVEMFIHFGPASWQNSEYDTLATPLSEIDPAKLDTDQWARVAVSMGAKQIVFAAKHTGGFCWWRTDTTGYGVKDTPWRGGKGDVVADLAKSCHRYGLKLGIYLSIRDDHWARANNKPDDRNAYGEAYNAIYRQQLTEVLTRYGRIDEVWFDGGIGIPIGDIIKKHAPHALLFGAPGELDNQLRWVGNEEGYSDYPNWNAVREADLRSGKAHATTGDPNGTQWMPVEVDTVNVTPHYWFWKTTPDRKLRSVDDLMDCYYRSVGYGCVLILNQTPDTTGLIPEADARRAAEFGAEVKRRFGKSVAETQGTGSMLDLELAGSTIIDHIVTMEDITQGERVREYTIQGKLDGAWKELCHGTAIGHKKIDRIPAVKVQAVRLICTKSVGEPIVRKLAVYYAGGPSR